MRDFQPGRLVPAADRLRGKTLTTFMSTLIIEYARLGCGVKLRRWTWPVLIVHGDRDRMVPFANAIEVARRLPGAQWLYPDSGHLGSTFNSPRVRRRRKGLPLSLAACPASALAHHRRRSITL
ncbi:alpha/beta fold hydrolase [Rhodococcus sp. NPDC127530]|uniref:alpha/beta fold hydrolase n=1 Tax=unclassified Rhodococcus (in: high G+C Gram-positive bacteria) TaxID=192944 RepID=UPI00362F9B98